MQYRPVDWVFCTRYNVEMEGCEWPLVVVLVHRFEHGGLT